MDFFTLEGVINLFKHSNDLGILAAWIHYCIFDLWTGQWIAIDYSRHIQSNILTKIYQLISLFFCLMLGPIGLCIYLIGKYTILPHKKTHKKKSE